MNEYNLSTEDEEFLSDIKDLSEEKKNGIIAYIGNKFELYDDLLLDVLFQAAGGCDKKGCDKKGCDKKGCDIIDNMCISSYEKACEYLEQKGLLKNINGRIYLMVKK